MSFSTFNSFSSSHTKANNTIIATPPTGVTVQSITSTSVAVSFTPPSGTITTYTATATPVTGGASVSASSTTSPITITGLTAGVNYVVRVNATGTSVKPTPISFNSTTIAGCLLWLDAADSTTITYSSGSNISQWADKSGSGNNMTQATVASQPVYGTMTNGKPGLNFASSKYMGNANMSFPTNYSVFVVGYGGGISYGRLLCGAPTDAVFFFGADVSGSKFATFVGNGSSWNDANANLPTTTITSLCLMEMTNNNTTTGLIPYVNGTSMNAKNGSCIAFTGVGLGYLLNSGQYWNGYVAEVLVYNSVLSTAQRQQVEGYLAWKWGLQTNLPSSHPYYSLFLSMSTPGCVLWLDAADPLNNGTSPADGTSITTWYDKSGNGRNATASGTITYNKTGINSKPAMTFTGTQNFYGNVPITGNTLTIFAIVTMNSSSSATARIIGLAGDYQGNSDYSNNSYITFQRGGATFIIQRNSVVVSSSSSTSYSTPYLVEGWVDGTNEYVTIQSGSTTNIGSSASTGNFAISAYTIGGNVYGSLNGFISEIIVYNTSLSTAQRQQVEGYLSWKWGLQANLPSSHPYYSLFLPMSAPGCLLWLDASDPLNNGTPPSSGTSITTWYDKSGNGRNATASGTITYNTSGINGKPAMTLGGSQNFYGNVPITGNTLTIFAIVTMNSSSSTYGRIVALTGDVQGTTDYSNNSYIAFQRSGTSFYIQRNSIVVGSTSSTSYSTPYLVEGWVDGTNEYVTIPSGSTTNIGSNVSTGNFAITTYTIGGNANGYLNGFVSEIIVYNTSLTTTQRQQIEGYLSWKWGLQANLPSTHPYYSSLVMKTYSLSPNYSAGTTVASLADFPTNLTFISSTANSLTFSFTAPTSGLTPSSYTPYVNGSIGTGSGTPSSYTVTGLTAGTLYSISLYANFMPQTIVPTSITGCLLWLDANDSTTITYSSGSNISQWADKSGLGNNMIQATAASQAVYGTMSNGKPGLNLASNKFMTNSTISFPTSYSVFAVGYGAGTSYGRLLTGPADTYIFFGADTTGANFASFVGNGTGWNDVTANSPNYGVNSLCLMEMTNNNTSTGLLPYLNGNAQTAKNGLTRAFTGLTFGSSGGVGQFWNGYVAEVLVYNSVLSTAQRQQVEGYLAWKWGLQANLPTSHPYYSFLPLSLSGCVLWLDAADSTTIVQSASKVSQWNDKSGSGYSVVQPTSANQPTYTTNLLNGKAGIALSGTTWLYQSGNNVPNFSSSSATSVFIVARNDSSLSTGGWSVINSLYINGSNAVSSTARYQLSFAINTTLGVNVWSNQALTGQSGAVGYGANALIGFTTSSTSSVISVNGTSASYGGVTLANANNSSTLLIIGDSRLNYIKDSVIYEMIGFNVQLTTTQQQQVEGYLAWKWGLQANLPTSHPYYSVAPGTNSSPTSSLSTVPGPPTSLTFISATATTITFSFTPPSGTITGYTPYINGFAATGSGTASSYTITGLTAATSYNVTMAASNSSGSSAQSSTAIFSTANNPPPGFISVQSITTTSITVAFTAPSGAVTNYVATATPRTGSAITATGTGSPITISGLASGTKYIITLQSIFNAISSSVSNGIAVATTLIPPTAVSLSSITSSSVAVNFSLVTGATSYTASANPTSGSAITSTSTSSPNTITGLSPSNSYTINIKAKNSDAVSIDSSSINVLIVNSYKSSVIQPWFSTSTSSTGQYMAASAMNVNTNKNTPIGVYVSSNYGVTWTSTFSGFAWFVSVSSTGQYMATCINDGIASPNSGGKIYVSTNYGVTWNVCSGSPNAYWYSVAISDNGTYITGTNFSHNICYSSNGGTSFGTFTCAGANGSTINISMSSTGQYQTVSSYSGTNSIYVSTNYGANWSTAFALAGANFGATSMSSTGQYQAACNGDFYLSTNYGVSGSWVKMAGAFASGSNAAISISSTGQYQIMSDGSAIYYSNNYGADGSWIIFDANVSVTSYSLISISKNGQYISAGNGSGTQTINVYNTLPNTPTNLSVQSTTTSSATIAFTPTTAGATSYLATASPGGLTGTSTSSPITISGLSSGTSYTITIQAITSFGTSAASSGIAVNTLLNPPTALAVQSTTSSSTTISFTPPSGTITSYLATASPGGFTGTSTGSPVTISGLSPGTSYTVTITAKNGVFTSSNSASITISTSSIVLQTTTGTLVGTGTYTLYKFTSATSSITLNGSGTVYYVIIGGGGGGGSSGSNSYAATGGGAGGITSGVITQLGTTTYNITVGAGATQTGGNSGPGPAATGNSGSPSSIAYNSTTLSAPGGSGGGTGTSITVGGNPGTTTKGLTGVTGVTESGSATNGGGAGTSVASITGYTITMTSPSFTGYYASGGGGGNNYNSTPYNNTYGGGQGGTASYIDPISGTANTGSGSGGQRGMNNSVTAMNATIGGSGIVLMFF